MQTHFEEQEETRAGTQFFLNPVIKKLKMNT